MADKGEGYEMGRLSGAINSSLDEPVGRGTLGSNSGPEDPTTKNAITIEPPKPEEFPMDNQVEVKHGCMRRCRAKCCSREPNKKQQGFETNPNLRVKNTIKRIVNGRYVLTIMTFVTIFALIGVSLVHLLSNLNFL